MTTLPKTFPPALLFWLLFWLNLYKYLLLLYYTILYVLSSPVFVFSVRVCVCNNPSLIFSHLPTKYVSFCIFMSNCFETKPKKEKKNKKKKRNESKWKKNQTLYSMYSTFLFVKFFWYSHTQSKCSNQKDREFVELEIPYNGQPKRPGSPSPMASPAHSTNSAAGLLQSCCGRCCSQRYQVSCPSVNTYIPTCIHT